ncbi:MAG: hypothetical protein R6T83_02095 [Salinibacter sp.]
MTTSARRLSPPLGAGLQGVCVPLLIGLLLAGCGGGDSDSAASNVVPDSVVEQEVADARERLTQNEGGERVLRAIEAHGGLAAWYRAPTSSYVWEYANEGADLHFASFMVVDNRTRRAYHDLLRTGPFEDPQPVDAAFAWTGDRAWVAPPDMEQPNPRFWALSGFYFQQIPFVFADPGVNYEALPDDTIDGTPHDMVRITFGDDVGDAPDDSYTLYLDKDSRRLDAIRYTVTFGRNVDADADLSETFFDYQDYVIVDSLTVPTRFEGYAYSEEGGIGETRTNWAEADSISYRRSFDESRLTPPDTARFVSLPGEEE